MSLALQTFLRDAFEGLFLVLHNGLALVGLVVVLVALLVTSQSAVLDEARVWLLARVKPASPVQPPVALDLDSLTPPQALVARWLARKYRVAPEPMAALVAEAHKAAGGTPLTPNLILAVAAIESNFHPFIESAAGAQGLMQVMPGVHRKRLEAYGGSQAAFDPLTNLRVGTQILHDFVRMKRGDVNEGLRAYLGGADLEDDGGYVAKVRAQEAELDRVAAGSGPYAP